MHRLKQAPMNFKQFSILMTVNSSLKALQTNGFSQEYVTLVSLTMLVKRYDLKMPQPKKVLAL